MLHPLSALPATGDRVVVLALCAEWCGACREFRPLLERIAAARPQLLFAWADTENDADALGDVDVDDFPTLLVARGATVLHYGVSLPLEAVVARLVDVLAQAADAGPAAAVPDAARELAQRLADSAAT